MPEIKDRVDKLERTLFRLGAIAAAVSVALGVSVGLTWKQIPQRALKAMEGEAVLQAEKVAKEAADEAVRYAKTAEDAASRASFNLCNQPKEACRCGSDSSGDYQGYVVVCVTKCEDGRIADFKVSDIRVGRSHRVCPENLPQWEDG